jgi:hypothetical protein
LPIAEAARRLGLSPKTLRRHAQQGTIPPELCPEKTAMGWYLSLPPGYTWITMPQGGPRGTPPSANGRPEVPQSEVSHGLVDAVAHGTPAVEVAVKAAVAAMWQERARNLEAQVEQLLALPAHEEEPARRWWQWWRRAD